MPSNRIEPDDDPARRVRDEPRDRQRRHALAAAGFADQAERLAVADVEAHVIDGLDDPVRREEVRRQAAYLAAGGRPCGRARRSRRHRSVPAGRRPADSSTIVGASAAEMSSSAPTTYCFPLSFGSSASRRPSPRKVKPISARAMKIAGKSTRCGSERMNFWPSAIEAAPRRARWLDADADVGERRLGEDRDRDAERHRDDDRTHPVGQQVSRHDLPIRRRRSPWPPRRTRSP